MREKQEWSYQKKTRVSYMEFFTLTYKFFNACKGEHFKTKDCDISFRFEAPFSSFTDKKGRVTDGFNKDLTGFSGATRDRWDRAERVVAEITPHKTKSGMPSLATIELHRTLLPTEVKYTLYPQPVSSPQNKLQAMSLEAA